MPLWDQAWFGLKMELVSLCVRTLKVLKIRWLLGRHPTFLNKKIDFQKIIGFQFFSLFNLYLIRIRRVNFFLVPKQGQSDDYVGQNLGFHMSVLTVEFGWNVWTATFYFSGALVPLSNRFPLILFFFPLTHHHQALRHQQQTLYSHKIILGCDVLSLKKKTLQLFCSISK